MIAAKNEGMMEAIRAVKEMSLRKTLRWLYDDYWKAKRDRWAEEDYIRDEGISEGKADSVLTLLAHIGNVPSDLREKIITQKEQTVLEEWLIIAYDAADIEDFRRKTGL